MPSDRLQWSLLVAATAGAFQRLLALDRSKPSAIIRALVDLVHANSLLSGDLGAWPCTATQPAH